MAAATEGITLASVEAAFQKIFKTNSVKLAAPSSPITSDKPSLDSLAKASIESPRKAAVTDSPKKVPESPKPFVQRHKNSITIGSLRIPFGPDKDDEPVIPDGVGTLMPLDVPELPLESDDERSDVEDMYKASHEHFDRMLFAEISRIGPGRWFDLPITLHDSASDSASTGSQSEESSSLSCGELIDFEGLRKSLDDAEKDRLRLEAQISSLETQLLETKKENSTLSSDKKAAQDLLEDLKRHTLITEMALEQLKTHAEKLEKRSRTNSVSLPIDDASLDAALMDAAGKFEPASVVSCAAEENKFQGLGGLIRCALAVGVLLLL